MRALLLAALIATFALAPATAQDAAPDAAPVPEELPEDFTLKPGDVISISVLEDTNLNRDALIRPDGKITLPIAGVIEAAGRKPEEVQVIVQRRLAEDFITPPTVSVALTGLGPINQRVLNRLAAEEEGELGRVYVIGEVGRSGAVEFPLDEPFTLLQALSVAGGPSVFGATERIQLRRQTDTGEEILLFDYEEVLDGERPIAPIFLMEGDVIVVPERGLFE